ncbi:RNA-directed DNA polymerase from mobile element jockey-like [Brachionus plicatilis]|uniref:RNA-directed DNA polymerase from mobile element jockey-like n=1 Tax=Brachionus plicatilis TaxID=10195 RepID=A0A3M7RJW9_BRAPC|nr:RNA-directed DNA polymerase from mobile element jockey-like [Brachionus plicatilis]
MVHQQKIRMNYFFTSISSSSECSFDKAALFVNDQLDMNLTNDPCFKFSLTTANEVEELLSTLPSTGAPGICGIPTKLLKSASKKLKTAIAWLFNYSIVSCSISCEWKTAVVTPLFKKKGLNEDMNNYRGILILPPIAKIFEKLVHLQILGQSIPEFVNIDNNNVEVVNYFKLLGITKDNRLTFLKYVAELRVSFNKLTNVEYFNILNKELSKYNLECYQHRLIKSIARFIYKVCNNKNGPMELKASKILKQ